MKKSNAPIPIRAGKLQFLKVNAGPWEWRDGYHWVLSLTWPRFVALVLSCYFMLNVLFALAYVLGGDCIAEMSPGSLPQAFFFSIETLATVGYGHMYPITTYAHAMVSLEIVTGMFWMAMMTGVIFVRFSRPTARIVFSRSLVIAPFDGKPSLMLRVANGRHQSMVEAEFRVMLHRDEPLAEGGDFRRFYNLELAFNHVILFPAAFTLRHIIDEKSPLYGQTLADLERGDSRFMVSVVGVDTVIPAPVQSQHDYHWTDVRFGEQFADMYAAGPEGSYYVDYGLLHETAPTPLSAKDGETSA